MRRFLRAVIFALILIGALAATPAFVHRSYEFAGEWHCRRLALPPEWVMFEWNAPAEIQPAGGMVPESIRLPGGGRVNGLRFIPWTQLAFSEPGAQGTVFLHQLKNPATESSRVVGVDVSASNGFRVVVVRPTSLAHRASRLSTGHWSIVLPDHGRDHLQLFAGQIDSNDLSRFTIISNLNGKPGMIEGRLLKDDTVELCVKTGDEILSEERRD